MTLPWWQVVSAVVEKTLSNDLDKLRNHFYNWQLKLNKTKIVFSAFDLANHLIDYELTLKRLGEGVPNDVSL